MNKIITMFVGLTGQFLIAGLVLTFVKFNVLAHNAFILSGISFIVVFILSSIQTILNLLDTRFKG